MNCWFARNRFVEIFRMMAIDNFEGSLMARDRNKTRVIPPADLDQPCFREFSAPELNSRISKTAHNLKFARIYNFIVYSCDVCWRQNRS